MSFSNLSPAERLKVSVLGGVIVIVLFFVVHTVLGALSPKKATVDNSGAAKQSTTTASTSAGAAVSVPSAPPAAVGADGFTGIKFAQASKSKLSDSPDLDMGTHDPFVPLQDTRPNAKATPGAAASTQPAGTAAKAAPDVSVKSARNSSGPDYGGGMTALPPMGLSNGGSAAMVSPAAVLPPPEPTIRIVGIVHGEPSVATIRVAERTVLARPGDALHTGYRLLSVGPEAVIIRHKGEHLSMRVGDSINEAKTDAKSQP